MNRDHPWIISPEELSRRLEGEANLRVIDLGDADTFARGHIPGSVQIPFEAIIHSDGVIKGLLADATELSRHLEAAGVTPETTVIACDDEGGGRAARLLWTLATAGHPRAALLDGGRDAWITAGLPTSTELATPEAGHYPVHYTAREETVATRDEILRHLGDPHYALWDARSPAEFSGEDVRAARGGHIPGAVNLEWTWLMDNAHDRRLKDATTIRDKLDFLGFTPDRCVITYCQTHHRSALPWLVLKWLGFPEAKGYPGAWSDWGNAEATPVTTGPA
ncbi:MAG: sulfurtransferase [Thiohalospira sp.]